jgi:hypothetical protein
VDVFPALCLFAALFGALPPAFAVNSAEESRRAEDLDQAGPIGESVWLEAGGTRFLALFDETPWPNRRGGVVILHDREDHPDRRPLPHALRRTLPRRGWAVLALQLGQGGPDTADRVAAGLAWLEARKVAPLALVGMGAGGRDAVNFRAGRTEREPRALALVEVDDPPDASERKTFLDALGALRLPVADIHGVRGTEAPAAAVRRATASRLNIHYRQSAVYDAPGRLDTLESLMASRIAGWLADTLRAASPGPSAPPAER